LTKEQQNAQRVHESEMWLNHAAELGILAYEDVEREKRILSAANTPSSSKHPRTKSAASVAYNCVFCGDDYSSKGTCKRHLDDMHVARKSLQCNKCKAQFRTVPEVRKHSDPCSSGILGWSEYKPPARHIYSSEFTNKLFRTQQQYTEHLLELCAKPQGTRPGLSLHKKLRNLLEQPALRDAVETLSLRIFGDADMWRNTRWEYERVRKAINDLEYGLPDAEPRAYDISKLNKFHVFVDELFACRKAHTSTTSHPDSDQETTTDEKKRQPSDAKVVKKETPHTYAQPEMSQAFASRPATSYPDTGRNVAETYYLTPNSGTATGVDSSTKRPLSYESASRIPERLPPGPSPTVPDIYTRSPLSANFSSNFSLSTSAAFEPLPLPSTMSAWQFSDQPPPYESMLAGSHTMPQQQAFGVGPMSLGSTANNMTADIACYSSPMQNMLPSNEYVPTQVDRSVMDMYNGMTGGFDGTTANNNHYHAIGAVQQDANASSWLNLNGAAPLHGLPSQHTQQRSGHNSNAGLSDDMYHDGTFDNL